MRPDSVARKTTNSHRGKLTPAQTSLSISHQKIQNPM